VSYDSRQRCFVQWVTVITLERCLAILHGRGVRATKYQSDGSKVDQTLMADAGSFGWLTMAIEAVQHGIRLTSA